MSMNNRTGRGDPQGSSSQHGAGCGMSVLLALPMALWSMWIHRAEIAADFIAEYRARRG